MSLGNFQIVSIILVASVVLLIDSSMLLDDCNNRCGMESKINWAIACSCISLFVTLLYVLGSRSSAGIINVYAHYFAMFFLFWWTFGVGVITFDNPYTIASNGYLSSWVAWCMSFYFCTKTVAAVGSAYSDAVGTETQRFAVGILIMASIVELIAGSVLCDKHYNCEDEVAFSVAAGVISLILCMLYLVAGDHFPLMYVALLLFIWWTISTGVLTFGTKAPFYLVGNGYISTWLCFITSLYLCNIGFGFGEKFGAMAEGDNSEAISGEDSQYQRV